MKSPEYWVALISGILFVMTKNANKPLLARIFEAGVSGGVGFSQAEYVASITGRSEVLAAFLLSAFGYFVLDVTASLVMDREYVKDLIKQKLGGDKQ